MRRDRVSRMTTRRVHGVDPAPPARWLADAVSWGSARTDPSVSSAPFGTSAIRTVLAAVDGTPFGEHALPFAAAGARRAARTPRWR